MGDSVLLMAMLDFSVDVKGCAALGTHCCLGCKGSDLRFSQLSTFSAKTLQPHDS